MMLLITCDGLG